MDSAPLIETNAAWPPPDASGCCVLTPTTAGLVRHFAIYLLMIVGGGVMAAPPQVPQLVRLKGLVIMATGLVLGAMFFHRLTKGAFELRLDDAGFSLGKKRYSWAEAGTFALGQGKKRKILYFGPVGRRLPLVNLYGMPGPALADFLNRQGARHGGPPAPAPRFAAPDLPPLHPSLTGAPRARRKTLPVTAWVAILAVFFLLLATGAPMAEAVWSLVAPGSYAANLCRMTMTFPTAPGMTRALCRCCWRAPRPATGRPCISWAISMTPRRFCARARWRRMPPPPSIGTAGPCR